MNFSSSCTWFHKVEVGNITGSDSFPVELQLKEFDGFLHVSKVLLSCIPLWEVILIWKAPFPAFPQFPILTNIAYWFDLDSAPLVERLIKIDAFNSLCIQLTNREKLSHSSVASGSRQLHWGTSNRLGLKVSCGSSRWTCSTCQQIKWNCHADRSLEC